MGHRKNKIKSLIVLKITIKINKEGKSRTQAAQLLFCALHRETPGHHQDVHGALLQHQESKHQWLIRATGNPEEPLHSSPSTMHRFCTHKAN